MVNAGKKRPAPGGGASSAAASSGKKLKIANKAKSSKSGGKSGAASKSLASKQRTFGGGDGAVSNGGAGGIPKRKIPAAGDGAAVDGKKKKLKGKGTVKEFVQLAKGKEVAQDGEDGQDDSNEDASSSDDETVDVDDMLMPDSDGEEDSPANGHAQDFLQRSAFLTQIDKKELARCVNHGCNTSYLPTYFPF